LPLPYHLLTLFYLFDKNSSFYTTNQPRYFSTGSNDDTFEEVEIAGLCEGILAERKLNLIFIII